MDNNKFLFDGIVIFCAVVECEGFTAAARKLGHTPSHVSKEIVRLEERLGVRLLNRTTRTVSLTEEGKQYYQKARQIIEDAQQAQTQISESSSLPSGMLKVSAPVSLGHACLNEWLPEFLNTYPDIRLTLESSDRMVDMVTEGFDVILRAGQLKDSDFVAKKLVTSRLLVVASPDYLKRAGVPQNPEELSQHTLIDFSGRPKGSMWEFNETGNKRVSITIAPRIICNSAETEVTLAKNGVGITRLPSFICQKEINSEALIQILEDYENPPIGIYAIYPSRTFLSPKVRVFVDFLVEKFSS